MIIFGIDPGTASTGYALVEISESVIKPNLLHTAVVSTPPDKEMHSRLDILYKTLMSICNEFSPDIMVVERLFFNTNVKTAMTVGQARGVTLLVAAKKKMKVFEYTALEAKRVVTGYGRSDKKEVQEAVRNVLGLKEIVKPDDANDAVAMTLCYITKELGGENATLAKIMENYELTER